MTLTSEVQNQTIVASDILAQRYDDLFARSRIGTQRSAIWEILVETFQPGDQILELNCGDAEDAIFLGEFDISVTACGRSKRMVHTAWDRMQADTPDAPSHSELLPIERLSELCPDANFNGALSNFSGLNSVADFNRTARHLAALVTTGSPVLVCLSTRFCFSETLWFLLHGEFRRAFRRSLGIATVKVDNLAVKVRYPTMREVSESFSPFFVMRSCRGIGVAVPPSYLEPILRKSPRALSLLRRIDRYISHLPLFCRVGDHMLLHFERV
jgi:hypothetical protein